MLKYSSLFCLALVAMSAHAFVANPRVSSSTSSTSLNALPPPMIIGPMIRRMREENAKKKAPMVLPDELEEEAPGLRVGPAAWKWPPVWPYDSTFFMPKADIPEQKPDIGGMANLLTGQAPPVPSPDEVEVEEAESDFDPIEYWSVEKADVTTDLDEEAAAKLAEHYAFYLKDGMSVLEIGAAEKSYLPEGLKLARHVGVGANQKLMDQNPALTESFVADLNKVIRDKGVDSEEMRQLAAGEPFDVIIMANTVDFLSQPREVFRSAWFCLKPGGVFMNAFSTKDAAYNNKFERAQTRMWKDYNDDQHMWVCGSCFHFSAGDGWDTLKGFDISPESAKDNLDDGPLKFLKQGKNNNIYVVQATRAFQDETIDPEDPEKSFKSLMWMLPTMEDRDKILVAPRLKRAYEAARDDKEKHALEVNIKNLPAVYENLLKMDTFVFGFGLQSQLAADLVSDPDFNGNDEQVLALKQGLGLRKPSEEFWAPVGESTSGMTVADKINLLSYIVPRFGSGDPDQEAALEAFASGMKPTYAQIRSKCPDLAESDVQLLGTELLASEVLIPGTSTREEFASWLGALSEDELKSILEERKQIQTQAEADLVAFKEDRVREEAEREARRQKIRQQVQKAREERTMAFNPQTGKMEPLKK